MLVVQHPAFAGRPKPVRHQGTTGQRGCPVNGAGSGINGVAGDRARG